MSSYEIGISGIHAAQKALTIIGNNIANAATEGYHRQEINLVPASESYVYGDKVGQGVKYAGVIRKMDVVLESEILRQESSQAEMGRRLEMLRTIESAFGELSTSGLSTAIDEFFGSFQNLSIRPEDVNLQSEVLSKGQTLVSQMNNLATMVSTMDEMAFSESLATLDRVNLLAGQIANLNQEIYNQTIRGHTPQNTLDQRDKLITELSRLIGVRTISRENGMVDIIASDISLVVGSHNTTLEIGLVSDAEFYQLGLRAAGADTYDTQISGGTLGGLFELRNGIIRDLQERLDALAGSIISKTNRLHVQGVGQDGSFTSMTGWTMSQTQVSEVVPPITPGTIHLRVTGPDGAVSYHDVVVDADDTIQDVADALAAIDYLDSSFSGGRMQIFADTGYAFDFLPGVQDIPQFSTGDPNAGTDLARATVTMGGQYSGTDNAAYTVRVVTDPPGQSLAVGNGSMTLVVENALGEDVAVVNVGQGYTPGQAVALTDGMTIALGVNGTSPGYLTDGEVFTIEAIAESDPTGFLAAVGINCFFSGTNAASMDLSDYISNAGGRIAASQNPDRSGSGNAVRISKIGEESAEELGSLSMKDYYRQIAVGLGNQISITQMQYENTDGVLRSLQQQRDEVSGVDINDQASLMMVYEQMFQAMARYINTINETQKTVLTLTS